MAFSLNDVQKGAKRMPRKVIIYGPPKLGKSTLAGATKKALMIPTEDRVSHINCHKTPVVHTFEEVLEVFDTVLSDNNQTYTRIIIDSLDWFEPILHEYVCRKKGLKSLTDDHNKETAFQKGLKYVAVEGWKMFLHNCDILRANGIDVILVAHSQTITVNPPDSDSYDKEVMKIDKNALSVCEEWADVIAFYSKEILVTKESTGLSKKGKAVATDKRILRLDGSDPSCINGNSFGLGDVYVELDNTTDIMEWMLTETKNNKKEEK